MEDCEICGKATNTQYAIEIEGAEMRVCQNCSKGKQVIAIYGKEEKRPAKPAAARKEIVDQEELVDGYGNAIRKAREALDLPIQVVAERISEKESTLRRVEEEKMQPSAMLVKRLEKELGIKLMTTTQPSQKPAGYAKAGTAMTLDDVAFKKEKK